MSIDQIKTEILRIVCEVLKQELDYETSHTIIFVNRELNSFTFLQFLVAVEDAFDIEFPEDQLSVGRFQSLDDVVEYIQAQAVGA
ncbi:acyl carrier protein [Paenibacillus xanthanilyticus]|uniref:Acyl carrier protein n=1 Tax=Paenibacillus xanthanilyticus TaxID=1783531 RepID=A0ABV8K1E0_9BACL